MLKQLFLVLKCFCKIILQIFSYFSPDPREVSRMTVRRGSFFSVSVQTSVSISGILSPILLSCTMALQGKSSPLSNANLYKTIFHIFFVFRNGYKFDSKIRIHTRAGGAIQRHSKGGPNIDKEIFVRKVYYLICRSNSLLYFMNSAIKHGNITIWVIINSMVSNAMLAQNPWCSFYFLFSTHLLFTFANIFKFSINET